MHRTKSGTVGGRGAAPDPPVDASAAIESLRPGEDLEGAVEQLRRAFEASPADVNLARLLADVLESSGQGEQARAVLERALGKAPRDPDLLVELAYARLAVGEVAGARQAFERALSMRPGDPQIRQPLAQVYLRAGDKALAAETLSGVPRGRASVAMLVELARLQLDLGRFVEAETTFEALGRIGPAGAVVGGHGVAWCRIRRGDWRGALEVLLDTIRVDRFDFTTELLAYAKDRLFTRVPDAPRRESELRDRLDAELSAHADLHGHEVAGETEEGIAGA